MKELKKIDLNNKDYWFKNTNIDKSIIDKCKINALNQIDLNMIFFGREFQSPQTFDGVYKKMKNIEWTNGFWTGLLWISYELTKDEKYKTLASKNIESFDYRLKNQIELNHHDIGFLYQLSTVADWKINQNYKSKDLSIQASKLLNQRYQKKGNFFQAWGEKNAQDNYRLIIDSLLNIPLIYWAGKETNDKEIFEKALKHFDSTISNIIRPDSTTYHTYFFEPVNGNPLYGKTRQGYSDDSCWARGQAWAIYGIALSQKYNKNIDLSNHFKSVLHVFLNKLPKDNVPFWDLIFNDGSSEPRDSSAASIVVCGILEMLKHLKNEKEKQDYRNIAHKIALSLMKNYTNKDLGPGKSLVLHSVYSYHSKRGNKGLDEGNIWGDYFYMEMMMRIINPKWNEYW